MAAYISSSEKLQIEFLHVSHELMENSTIMLVIFPICNCWSIWNSDGYKFIIIEWFQNSGGFLTNLKMLEGWSTCSCTFNDIIITLDTSLCLIIHLLSLPVNSGYFSFYLIIPLLSLCVKPNYYILGNAVKEIVYVSCFNS